jgi:branched-chain amino acid transport system permease protein
LHLNQFVNQFWLSTVDGLVLGSIFGLIALGYTMVYGVLKLINFAHSEVFMVGTVAVYGVLSAFNTSGLPGGVGLVGLLIVCSLAAMAASGAVAIFLERVAYRPPRRRGASRLAALISAIGMSFALQEVFALWVLSNGHPSNAKRDPVTFDKFMGQTPVFHIGSAAVTSNDMLVVGSAVIMMFALDRLVGLTKLGRGIRSVAQDPETAVLMGVDLDRVIMYTFLIGGLMAGVAATLFDVHYGYTAYNIGQLPGIKAFTAAVLGGIGNLRGALLGGLLIGLIQFYGASIFGTQWQDPVVFIVLVVVLLFRPTGILGESLARARA